MKLHLVGEKIIPNIVDDIFKKFEDDFTGLVASNKILTLRIFNTFKYLPINYNRPFFNQILNYLKSVDTLQRNLLI
jgi:hypothetical protein